MSDRDIRLEVAGRQKDALVRIDRSNKALTFSLSGGGSGYAKAMVDTTENWGLKPTFIPGKGTIVVYMDYGTIIREGETVNVPGIKIGDGLGYLVDLPFVGQNWTAILEDHINDTSIHVTSEEKQFWNEKLNCEYRNDELILVRK